MKIEVWIEDQGSDTSGFARVHVDFNSANTGRIEAAEEMAELSELSDLPSDPGEMADQVWEDAAKRFDPDLDYPRYYTVEPHIVDIPLLPAIWWAVKRWLKKLAARVQRRINPSPAHQIDEANDAFFALSSGRSVLQVIDAMQGLPSTRATQLSNTLAFSKWMQVHQDEVFATSSTANTRRPAHEDQDIHDLA
jgi:hypothetical protein